MSKTEIDALVHDVNAKCSNLRSAAALLRDGKPEQAQELLTILATESEKLGRVIANFQGKQGGEGVKK